MVGLADLPCVGKFVDRISEATVDAMFRGLRYMFCYKSLVNQLNSDIGKLNIEKDRMSRKVEEEHNNGKVINDHVLTWQKDVEEIQKSAEEFSPSCSCIQRLPIPNPVSRFRIGRNAAKKAKTVTELTGSGKVYLTEGIAQLPPVKNMPKPATTFEEFQSRKDVYQKLWDALVNEDSPLIHGIYGMAGVGKTRMMEQFWEDAMEKNIFDKVVRVNVGSENSDTIKLQEQIASSLDCKLDSQQDVGRRASQLENSLRNGGKILLVLDDIWEEIHLNDIIGAPFGDGCKSNSSKILLTSREKDVCLLNKCRDPIQIKTLSPDEALNLFRNTVGPDTLNSLQDESLVRKVCDECGELPLLICAVGKALKDKPHNSWKDAHNQLKKGKFEKIPGVPPQVYVGIKLSIDHLKDDDAKSCLFLCSLFPEDANIDMRLLIQLATGSQLIPDGESRVLAMVHYLKISSLLLDSGKDNETKVHDIIRDVARSIAFTDSKYAFLQVTCSSRYLPSNANYSTRRVLRLDAETDNVHFDEHLVCPDLHTLWLLSNDHPQQFSGGFFSMFVNLSCLMLQNAVIFVEHFSFQPLANLATLSLLKCDISLLDARPFPENLKTLCICETFLPRPLDLANLKCLRKLEIQRGPVLVMENVISSLSSLEELHVWNGFVFDYDEYHLEPIVMEISKLTLLTSLYFKFYKDEHTTLQGTDIFPSIDGFNVFVGTKLEFYGFQHRDWEVPLTRSIEFSGPNSKPWEALMARAEKVVLCHSDVEVSSICNDHTRAFEDLKSLHIKECYNMVHLASISSDEIQYSVRSATCFSKLTILQIFGCETLKYLFCHNIAKGLVQLQELDVGSCKSMEAIIMHEGSSDGEIINLSKLKSLTMKNLVKLTSFYTDKSVIPSVQYQPLFNGMVEFPSLEKLNINALHNTSDIWRKDCYNDTNSSFCKLISLSIWYSSKLKFVIPHGMLHRLHNLENVEVYFCGRLRTIFSSSVAGGLTHLKKLAVKHCEETRYVIEAAEQVITDAIILFPELTDLVLIGLPRLKSFWCSEMANTCKVPVTLPRVSEVALAYLPDLKSFIHGANFEFHLPALKNMYVHTCGLLTLFTFSMFTSLELETLTVNNCESLENIIEELRSDETCDKTITLSQLTTVTLQHLPNLESFFHNANYELHMPVIRNLTINNCGLTNALFTRSTFKNLKQLEILSVCDCELLESICEDASGDETLDPSDKIITLNRLRKVYLEGLLKFKSIFFGATYKCYMPNLWDATIVGCGLSILFKCSMFPGFRELRYLHISECESLEHIVLEDAGDETSEINGKSIKSSKLLSITLESLPKLKSFGCTFDMPQLHTFKHIKCPQFGYSSS